MKNMGTPTLNHMLISNAPAINSTWQMNMHRVASARRYVMDLILICLFQSLGPECFFELAIWLTANPLGKS